MNRRSRLLIRLALRMYPRATAGPRHTELAEALEDTLADRDPGTEPARLGRELFGLLRGAAIAWRLFIASPAGVRSGLGFGAALWFGILVGAGPLLRLLSQLAEEPGWNEIFGAPGDNYVYGLLGFAPLLTARAVPRRALATAVLAVGVAAAAAGNRTGAWGFGDSVLYELGWLGLAGIAMLLLRGRARSVLPALLGLGVGTLVTADFWLLGHNYGMSLREASSELMRLQYPIGDVVSVAIVLAAIAAPFLTPGIAAAALPALTHITVHLLHEPYSSGIGSALITISIAAAIAVRLALAGRPFTESARLIARHAATRTLTFLDDGEPLR